jgi:integrase
VVSRRKPKTRINGEGSIYQRQSDGRWVGQYFDHTAVPPKYRYVYAKTQAEALRRLNEAMASLGSGLDFDAGRITLGEFLDRWIEDSVKDSVKPSTYENYAMLTHRHLIPALRRNKLKTLTPDHVRKFRSTKLNSGLSTRTVQLLLTLLRKALQQAVNDGLVPRNVAQDIKVHQARKGEVRHLTPDQARRLLSSAGGDRLEALYVLAIHTGLRQGELLALKWDDIDYESETLSVKRTLSAAKDGPRFTAPKTKNSRRTVPLTPDATGALQRHKAMQVEEKCLVGDSWEDSDLVFRSTTGTPIQRNNLVARSFKPLLDKAGLPPTFRFHDLRHTAASLLFSRGLHPKIVQEVLGHSTIAITLDVYSHMVPGMVAQAAKAMEDALS